MSGGDPGGGDLQPTIAARIDEACDRFEAAWRAGRRPRIEEVLEAEAEPWRPELLRHLLAVELAYRRRGEERTTADEYRQRFPGYDQLFSRLFAPGHDTTLDRRPGCGGDGPAGEAGTDARPAADPDRAAGDPPRVGKYRVVRPLGSGGQATATLAFDPDLERYVVLKRYHFTDGAGVERALAEGRALARVRSPYVAGCLGAERHGEEVLLVVEHVAGGDLARAHRERSLTPAAAARVIALAAEGLAAVHACGLLHRDLKPANVLLGDDGTPRLVDFGLAAGVGSVALGELSGTPAYMAPEQARPEPERVGARTDVFGLGAVLYFLLTGSPPHGGRDAAETLELARRCAITPPRDLNPRVPRPLERICLRALSADPAGRQATAAELAAELGRFARGPRRVVGTTAAAGVLLLAALGLPLVRSVIVPGPPAPSPPTRPGTSTGRWRSATSATSIGPTSSWSSAGSARRRPADRPRLSG
jgi:serine/threonine-protein kinase